jgi:hypothetical protein
MNSTADIVMENNDIRRMILSIRIKLFEGLIAMFSKNPNRKAEKVVKIAFSLNTEP